MFNTKMMTLIAAGALAACLALVGCGGGTQAASSSAASAASAASSAASAPAATESSAASASAATEAPAATSAAAESASAAATGTTTTTTTTTTDSYIGENAALETALSDAGLTANEVAELEVELDLDDAVVHYDVNFKQGGMEYDYDIDATTGAILNSTSEVDD